MLIVSDNLLWEDLVFYFILINWIMLDRRTFILFYFIKLDYVEWRYFNETCLSLYLRSLWIADVWHVEMCVRLSLSKNSRSLIPVRDLSHTHMSFNPLLRSRPVLSDGLLRKLIF